MKRLRRSGKRMSMDQAFQYRSADSPVHRLGTGWKLGLVVLMGAAAIAARELWALCGLLALNLIFYLLAGLKWCELWRDLRFFVAQTVIVVGLYMIRDGISDGLWPGLRTGARILLFFMPSIILLRTTQSTRMMQDLKRFLPDRLAFIVFTSLRFVPFFARELREIAMAQRLRGAHLAPRRLVNPRNWGDLLHCLMLPLIVRAIKTANEAALSAEARGFGRTRTRVIR